MNKDTKDIINHTASTVLNIAQMAQYGVKYAEQGDVKDKQRMIKHTILAGVGIVCLLTIGIIGLIESRKTIMTEHSVMKRYSQMSDK